MGYLRSMALAALACLSVQAQHTPAQAEAIVKRAIGYAKQHGKDKLIQQTNQADGVFHVGSGSDLYLFVYDTQGLMLAIGFNPAAYVGKNRLDTKDPDGKAFVKEFITVAKTKGSGWVDYKYANPVSGKVEPKTSYVELADGIIYGCGVYK